MEVNKALKEEIIKEINSNLEELKDIRTKLYENPEIGGEEVKTSQILQESLERHGFYVENSYYNVKNGFKASYDSKKDGATIGIFAEFDALPDIGHGCGHNLICTVALGAAYGLKKIINDTGGKIVVFGTPGEENLCTKTSLTPLGAFDEIDVALMVHPSPITYSSGKTLAIESLQIEFFGKKSHAGIAPEKGKNALDAAVYCYQAINFEKQYYKNTNVYGVINDGGQKASVIPDYSSLKFLNRAWSMQELRALKIMLTNCAEAAAKMTGCTYKIWNNEATNKDMLTNNLMSDIFNNYIEEFGEKKIRHENVSGSTDMGDVSHRIPSIHPWVGLDCSDLVLHSREFADVTVSQKADEYIERCCKALACTAMNILTDNDLLNNIKKEFENSDK